MRMHISIRNGVSWDMGLVHYGVYEIGRLCLPGKLALIACIQEDDVL